MKKPKILVIENDEELRQPIVEFLGKNGSYEIFQAANGREGIKMFESHHPDIVIVDLHLSGARGEEIARFIKSDPKTETKVICLNGDPNLEKVATAAGCDIFLTKPFHLLQLQEAVEKLLKKNCIKVLK